MSLTLGKTFVPATPLPRSDEDQAGRKLAITVVFTSVGSTLVALKAAATMANSLEARITLVVFQTVPYPLPLKSPPVLQDFNEKRFRVIASESPVETNVQIYLCRDRRQTLASLLKAGSIVVLGGPKRWWPTKDQKLARQLRRMGYEVVFKETE